MEASHLQTPLLSVKLFRPLSCDTRLFVDRPAGGAGRRRDASRGDSGVGGLGFKESAATPPVVIA